MAYHEQGVAPRRQSWPVIVGLFGMEAAGIEPAKGGSAPTRDQRHIPRFPSENGAPICPGESMRVRSIWSFFLVPLDPSPGESGKPSSPGTIFWR
jgi:hypothetical protein